MRKKLLDRYRAGGQVVQFILQNAAVLGTVPAAEAEANDVVKAYNLISPRLADTAQQTQELTRQAKQARLGLMTNLTPLIGPLRLLGLRTNDTTLLTRATMGHRVLNKMRPEAFRDVAQDIIQLAHTRATDLAPYGITDKLLDAADQHLATYATAVPRTRVTIGDRVVANASVEDLIQNLTYQLRELDLVMEVFRALNPDLFARYKQSRKIVDTGARPNDSAGSASLGGVVKMVVVLLTALTFFLAGSRNAKAQAIYNIDYVRIGRANDKAANLESTGLVNTKTPFGKKSGASELTSRNADSDTIDITQTSQFMANFSSDFAGSLYTELLVDRIGLLRLSFSSAISASEADSVNKTGKSEQKDLQTLIAGGGNFAITGTYPLAIFSSKSKPLNRNTGLYLAARAGILAPSLGTNSSEISWNSEIALQNQIYLMGDKKNIGLFTDLKAAFVYASRSYVENLVRNDRRYLGYGLGSIGAVLQEKIVLKVTFPIGLFGSADPIDKTPPSISLSMLIDRKKK